MWTIVPAQEQWLCRCILIYESTGGEESLPESMTNIYYGTVGEQRGGKLIRGTQRLA